MLAGQLVLTGPAEDQKLIDDVGKAVDLPHGGVQLAGADLNGAGLPVPEAVLEVFKPQSQPGQRCAELMGGVGDEVLLRPQQPSDPLRHLVEGTRQGALLGAALDGHRRVEFSRRRPGGQRLEAADRLGDLAGDQRSGRQPQEKDDAGQRRQVQERRPHRAVHGGNALSDPDRAGRLAAAPGSGLLWRGFP